MKKILICIGLTLMLSACGSDHIIRFNLAKQQQSLHTKVEAIFSYGECGKRKTII